MVRSNVTVKMVLETRLESCKEPDNEDVVAGILEAVLDELPAPIAEAKHSATIKANGYSLVSELRELSRKDLEKLGVPPGHAKAIVRKICAKASHDEQAAPAEVQRNETATSQRKLIWTVYAWLSVLLSLKTIGGSSKD